MELKSVNLEKLAQQLAAELPGVGAQMQMAPLSRQDPNNYQPNKETRKSGVLVLLYPHLDTIHTVLILRPIYQGVHSGQIAFPGGKVEPQDSSITETALREAEEEIGVKRQSVQPLGKLTPLYIPPSNSMVTPTVGFAEARPNFVCDPREVDRVIETPLSHFLSTQNSGITDIRLAQAVLKDVPYYDLHGHVVWGATAMMLSEFTTLLARL